MNETETKPKLSKHISAAVTQFRKQIDINTKQVVKRQNKAKAAEDEAEQIRELISELRENIAKLGAE